MANEFVVRKGLIVSGNAYITGSAEATSGFTGSLLGSSSYASVAQTLLGSVTSASFASTASYLNPTPKLEYFGKFLNPDSASYAWWQPSVILDSNDLAPQTRVLIYSSSINGRIKTMTTIPIPSDFGSGATVGIQWKTSATTGNAVWVVEYRSVADGESLDPSTWQSSGSVTGSANGTARYRTTSEVTLIDSDFAANDTVIITVCRERNGTADTLAAEAELVDAYFKYTPR